MNKDYQKGVSIFLAVSLMSIVFIIVLGISLILASQLKITRATGRSVTSFFVADSGIERTYYIDRKLGSTGTVRGLCNIVEGGECSSVFCEGCENCETTDLPSNYNRGSCDRENCVDCKISFNSEFNDKKYEVIVLIKGIEPPPQIDYVDPDGDGWAMEWSCVHEGSSPNPCINGHYDAIDKFVRNPTTPSLSDYIYTSNSGSSDYFTMSTVPEVGEVKEVKVWIYGRKDSEGRDVGADIYMGGWQGGWHGFGIQTTPSWKSVAFSGKWNQADLDNLKIELTRADGGTGATFIYAMYAEITYLPSNVPTENIIKSFGTHKNTKRAIEITYLKGMPGPTPSPEGPIITNADVEPHSVPEGKKLVISADIIDPDGVDPSTTWAHIQSPDETEIDAVILDLIGENKYEGTWTGSVGTYYVDITACDLNGNCSEEENI